MIAWSHLFPVDVWWRKRHGVTPFSKAHLDTPFVGMAWEFMEDRVIAEQARQSQQEGFDDEDISYVDTQGRQVKLSPLLNDTTPQPSGKELLKDFEDLDLSKFEYGTEGDSDNRDGRTDTGSGQGYGESEPFDGGSGEIQRGGESAAAWPEDA